MFAMGSLPISSIRQGEAAYADGQFFAEPMPVVALEPPSRGALGRKEEFARDWGRWY